MKILAFILIALLFAVLLFIAFQVEGDKSKSLQINSEINIPLKTPNNEETPAKKIYTKPEIGMNVSEFLQLCGSKGAKTYTRETAKSDYFSIDLQYTEERSKNYCWGRFSFIDNELDAITRY